MSRLKDDFPGFAELDAAGEATTAKVRKRIHDETLTEIPGIGPATAEKIKAAFQEIDTPADQAKDVQPIEDDENITPASQAAERAAKEQSDEAAVPEQKTPLGRRIAEAIRNQDGNALTKMLPELDELEAGGGTLLNQGGPDEEARAAGEAEASKTGVEKNQLPGHDLSELSPAERDRAGVRESTAERITRSGAVYVHDPAGPYASRTAVRIPQGAIRIKVDPIAHVSPQKGMMVRDGDDQYAIQEDLGPDAKADDWLKVRSPNTDLPFIRRQ